ncbi:MAG: hypothetical protein A3J24_03590 [Deltaproteobacteria bacterium RIFCSPLOWO2_02_FULL_53_8]|nr:MAG: hypothetical protein A3J24_03590 [Deltaproteobacteria bacterium RIFCSPLOWO2_02_FULL_53_8]
MGRTQLSVAPASLTISCAALKTFPQHFSAAAFNSGKARKSPCLNIRRKWAGDASEFNADFSQPLKTRCSTDIFKPWQLMRPLRVQTIEAVCRNLGKQCTFVREMTIDGGYADAHRLCQTTQGKSVSTVCVDNCCNAASSSVTRKFP